MNPAIFDVPTCIKVQLLCLPFSKRKKKNHLSAVWKAYDYCGIEDSQLMVTLPHVAFKGERYLATLETTEPWWWHSFVLVSSLSHWHLKYGGIPSNVTILADNSATLKGKQRGLISCTYVIVPSSLAGYDSALGFLEQTLSQCSFHVRQFRTCPDAKGKSYKISQLQHTVVCFCLI